MNIEQLVESMAVNEQIMTPAEFRSFKSKWLVQLTSQIDMDEASVDVIALVENIRDSFLGE